MKITFDSFERFEGQSLFPPFIEAFILDHGLKRVAEIGAGANPAIPQSFCDAHGIDYFALDADAGELQKGGSAKTVVFDMCKSRSAVPHGPFDLIFEGTGNSAVVFDSMQALGKNGVLVLASVTGGDKMIQVPADRINLEFVLGNKVMVGTVNANREYFEMGVGDMAQAEAEYPGWLSKLLTDPVKGLENYTELFEKLTSPNGAIKVFCEVA